MKNALLLSFAAATAFAAAPVITDLQPRGAERGRPFTLAVAGRYLAEGVKIQSQLPATFTALAPPTDGPFAAGAAQGRYAFFLVESQANAPVGTYPIRVENADGVSNILLFTIGTFPESVEEESQPGALENSNDSIENAQPVRSGPVTLNGNLKGAERDIFRVTAKAGERRVFEVEGRRAGSAIDPVIRILDAAGRQIARNEDAPGIGLDARIDFTFPKDGNYYVEITDARFSRQVQNFYRLKMGAYPYADEVFPLGGQRGQDIEVTLSGSALAKPVTVPTSLKQAGVKADYAWVNLPDSATLPMPFAIGELPEVREPATDALSIPIVVNGRLTAEGEIDRYRLRVKPGQPLLLEVQARDLGTSKIMALLTVKDKAGKQIASAGSDKLFESPTSVGQSLQARDPFLNLRVPGGVDELTVTIEDLAQRGGAGYSYRLIAREQSEDFNVTIATPQVNIPQGGTAVVTAAIERRGYDGPVQLRVVNLPKGLKAEGGFIPTEGERTSGGSKVFSRRGSLLLTAESSARVEPMELEIWGEAKLADGTVLRRRARGIGMQVPVAGATLQGSVDRQRNIGAPWFGFELPAATTNRPSAMLEVAQVERKREVEGDKYTYRWNWTVNGKQRTPDEVNIEIPGINDIRIIDMARDPKNPLSGTFVITTTKATMPSKYDLYVSARIGGDSMGDNMMMGEEIYSRPVEMLVEEVKVEASSASSNN